MMNKEDLDRTNSEKKTNKEESERLSRGPRETIQFGKKLRKRNESAEKKKMTIARDSNKGRGFQKGSRNKNDGNKLI